MLFSINYYNVIENGKIKIGPHMSNNLGEINVVVISECICHQQVLVLFEMIFEDKVPPSVKSVILG